MVCKVVHLPGGGVALIKLANRRTKPCIFCGGRSTLLCDYPRGGGSKTCDAPLCRGCAVHVGPNRDYCRDHPAVRPSGDGGGTT